MSESCLGFNIMVRAWPERRDGARHFSRTPVSYPMLKKAGYEGVVVTSNRSF